MKIHILKNGNEFNVEVGDNVTNTEMLSFISSLFDKTITESAPVEAEASTGDSETFAEHYGCQPAPRPSERDTFSFRERLPNNVVDIGALDIKQAVSENALVRCPKCGQNHAIVLRDKNKLYLMRRSYAVGEFGIVMEVDNVPEDIGKICCGGDSPEEKLTYFHSVQSLNLQDDKDFSVTNETEIFCPVCKESSPFMQWKDAHEHKEHYFEFEHVCGVCGGECIMDAKEEKDGKGLVVCTKCGRKWMKEQVE